ncbi:penicillin acylase family protein [Spirosoma oryzicola]|uniref:penicillin acylase family protein n=1 Tax=Spirosoma oryzicola TaxID=2898794 RepID=UPI001E44A493|nr:penicillin acylase family protein [Spirosoma oryzicola]UHG94014.1 penicillin acylase family protein [Spirosoma oryzicola]
MLWLRPTCCLEFIGGREAVAAQVMLLRSNAYAIAPAKSAFKKATLVRNPHLPWEGFSLFLKPT